MYQLGFVTGISLHLLAFRKGEWDRVAHKIFYCEVVHLLAIYTVVSRLLPALNFHTASSAASITAAYGALHASGIFLSMLIYRMFFHRLRHFPGRKIAALSNFYAAFSPLKSWRAYEDIQNLHTKHGDYVRVGPTELSVSDPAAVSLIYGSQSRCTRGPLSNMSPQRYMYNLDRNRSMHMRRRRNWVKAFGSKAVREYDSIVDKRVKLLEDFLDVKQGTGIDVTNILRFTCFDILFETMYGRDAGCMSKQQQHLHMRTIFSLKTEMQPIQHLPWIVSLGRIWPWARGSYTKFQMQSDQIIEEELQLDAKKERSTDNEAGHSKAFDYFLDVLRKDPDRQRAISLVKGDVDLSLLAAWDNPSTALVAALYHLSQSPSHLAQIHDELRSKQDEVSASLPTLSSQEINALWNSKLAECEYLNSTIYEVMRLHPPVAEGVQRQTPPEGLHVGDIFIPGDVVVSMPQHTLSRDPRFFVDPNSFRPERWTTRPELVIDGSVFMPFGTGYSPCPGRGFAMRFMKAILSAIVLNWDFDLAPGVPANVLEEVKREKFNIIFGAVDMVFQRKH